MKAVRRFFTVITFISVLSFSVAAQTIIRGPYLQNLTQQSINILWRTSEPVVGKVWVGTSPDNLNLYFESERNDINHQVTISGLIPDTKYYYSIADENNHPSPVPNQYFKTAPASTEKPVKIWVTGDFGSKSKNQIEVRESFERSEHIDKTNLWLWLGDNAYPSGKDSEFQEKVFSKDYGYDSIMRFLPFFAVPGNHDYRSVKIKSMPDNHTGPYYDIIDVPTKGQAGGAPSNTEIYYSFDYGDIHFVALNSEAYKPKHLKNSAMVNWLEKDLKQNSKKWLIVFFHQPPYSKGSHNSENPFTSRMKAMREVINPIIEKYGADLVLTGHSHVYERSYLINGHYKSIKYFNKSAHVVQNKSGYFSRGEHYIKNMDGEYPNRGTVYVVVGNSGKGTSNPPLGHPVFYYEDGGPDVCGSLIIDVEGDRLDGTYLKKDGSVGEVFTLVKKNSN